jgi:hypothetical protein
MEFMKLLDSTIEESSEELRSRVSVATLDRYKSGLTLALYKLNQLSIHVQKSKRILNDLCLIRSALTGDGIIEAEKRSAKRNESSGAPGVVRPAYTEEAYRGGTKKTGQATLQ